MKKTLLIIVGVYLAVSAVFFVKLMSAGNNAMGQGPQVKRSLIQCLIWPGFLIRYST